MIIRKGDPAHSFYFIYSGGVSFSTDLDGSSAFKEEQQADLRKGARFGVSIPSVCSCGDGEFTGCAAPVH